MSIKWKPKYGDVVLYRGQPYYFTPNGSSCYLYERREQVGITDRALWCPSRKCIEKPDPRTVEKFKGNVTPRHVPDRTVDNLVQLVTELHYSGDILSDSE
jgi:hypothetical protein